MSEPEKLRNRRSFSPEFKVKVVLELVRGERTVAGASVHYNIKETVLSRWKQEFLLRAPQVFAEPSASVSDEIDELKKLVGEQTIELSILKKAFGISNRKRVENS